MAKVTTRKKKRTTDSRTRCVTTRCCVECPRPSRRRRRRQVASKSLPLSRAMPMPLPSLQNIMPTPFMPLNIPLPRVEQNRRPPGTHQLNNQPIRVQQKSTRSMATMTDTMVRGVTNQKAPITNAPNNLPLPRPSLGVPPRRPGVGSSPGRKIIVSAQSPTPRQTLKNKGSPLTPQMDTPRKPPPPSTLPNVLDFKGTNALGVSNQGENLRDSPLVEVTRNELLRSSSRNSLDEGESVSGSSRRSSRSSISESGNFGKDFFFASQAEYGKDVGRLRNEFEEMGLDPAAATREARKILSRETQSIIQQTGYSGGEKVRTLKDYATSSIAQPKESVPVYATSSTGGGEKVSTRESFPSLGEFAEYSGGAGGRVATDTDTELSRYEGYT